MSHQGHADRNVIRKVMPAVVQLVALQRRSRGNYQAAWTGSGTIVHPQGVILTNCHVANPRAMGMPSPQADALAVAITERSDQPPALTYVAEIVAQSPKMDLAVLRIVQDVNGRSAKNLKLPYIPVGDSDELELGDIVSIFGYPGIGGETITFTSGSVSGFTHQRDITPGRAWIKTDATISGGNSGGTAVDAEGRLVGVPTQAAAGTGISPVDARPVVDTNRDGRIDQRDTPMAIGGFINGLRPVNMAEKLLKKAGVTRQATSTKPAAKKSSSKSSTRSGTVRKSGLSSLKKTTKSSTTKKKVTQPEFRDLVFSENVTSDGRPINPGAHLRGGTKKIYASFVFDGMRNGRKWSQTWAVNGETVFQDDAKWEDGPRGRKIVVLTSRQTMPDGRYHLILTVSGMIAAEGEVVLGRQVDDTDTEISGQIIDRDTKRGLEGALVIALKPGVATADFVREQRRDMAYTSTKTNRNGRFTLPKQLPKGQSYGMIVVARGYRDMAIDSALRVSDNAPEQAQIYPVPMIRD